MADNRQLGLLAVESTVTMERCVIKGTLPQTVDQKHGYGIFLRSIKTQPGKLTLTDSTISDSSSMGLFQLGGEATLKRVVIRKTGSARGNNAMPHGLSAGGGVDTEDGTIPAARLDVDTCLWEDNIFVGLLIGSGSDVVVSRSTVRSSRARSWISKVEQSAGGGIWVQEMVGPRKQEYKLNAKAQIRDSLVEQTEGPGLTVLFGGTMSVERSVIRDTGALKGLAVPAVLVQGSEDHPKEPSPVLSIKHSAVKSTPGVGVQLSGAKVYLERCMVESTRAPFGDGISVKKTDKRDAYLGLTSSLVKDSTRAGLILFGGAGKVCRSTLQKNKYAIVLEQGAKPVICEDNKYVDNERDVVFGLKLEPARLPDISGSLEVPLPKTGN